MRLIPVALLLIVSFRIGAQENKPAFWDDVQAFKSSDSIHFPPPNQVLLTGSSTFTKWDSVHAAFPNHKILNRAFGGSTLDDLIRYAKDVIFPYKPKQIVIYCGENDFTTSDTVSVRTVVSNFKKLFNLIRTKYKTVPIAYVSMKPSPRRQRLLSKYVLANNEIKEFLATQKNTKFINVFDKMLKPDGTPMDDIFIEDRLHLNGKGYAIWQEVLEPYLLK
jgi:lysophospholipase L1-like esterase